MTEKEEFLKKFGAHIRKLREKQGISLREFELRGDIDRHMMSRIENGQTNPTIYSLKGIAKILQLEVKDLIP